jgi:uncharacterized protein YbjT (DUF2867 family)
MTKILVAGASGKLGTEILHALKRQNHYTRALVRDPLRLHAPADHLFIADARQPDKLKGVCDGIDAVISALGASLHLGRTHDGANFHTVDYEGNWRLLEQAKAAGVRKFVYVSMHAVEKMPGVAYVAAHESFVAKLKESGLNYAVMRPTGFFYLFDEILKMARRPFMPLIGGGHARTNPIHEADLATACVESLERDAPEWELGGPQIFTRREIAEIAARAWGRQPRFFNVSLNLMRGFARQLRRFDQRLGDLMDFGAMVSTVDVVAPQYGTRKLADFFAQQVKTKI